jgi:hypothetical protein
MNLDEARHFDIAKLMREHRCPDRLSAELCGGEARRKGEGCFAEAQAKRRMPDGQAQP